MFGVEAGGGLAKLGAFRMNEKSCTRQTFIISAVLLLATVILYWPVHRFEFINLDDPTYVTQNPFVTKGFTWATAGWAFTAFHMANWHPLTWLSHSLDVSLFGLKPAGHHLVNVLFHSLNAVLLLWWLRQMTGSRWRSAIVAALFALHPTHVESVAWVSERKDVLSTFFGLLCLIAYSAYARSAECGVRSGAIGKLDISPKRTSSVLRTSSPQSGEGNLPDRGGEGAATRKSGLRPPASDFRFLTSRAYWLALLCFALGLMSKPMLVTWPFVLLLLDVWPLGRASLKSKVWSLESRSLFRGLLLEKIPFFMLTVGSCVLTFLAQRAGGAVQSLDYLPLAARVANAVVSYARYVGKTLWPAELSAYYPHPVHWPTETVMLSAGFILALVAVSLWFVRRHAYGLVGLCWFLGTLVPVIGLVQVGAQAIADRYLYVPQIGLLIALVWGASEVFGQQKQLVRVGVALAVGAILACAVVTRNYLPRWANSVVLFEHALKVNPQNPPALYSLGLALVAENKLAEAIPYLEKAATMRPDVPSYHGQLALLMELQGDTAGAIARYRKCLEIQFDLPEALNNLAWILATAPNPEHRNGAEAIRLATRACELARYEWPMFLGTLAASYAEAGRFAEAVQTAEKAERMARERGFIELADKNVELLKTYRAGQPHREAPPPQ